MQSRNEQRSLGWMAGWIFLGVVIGIYGVCGAFSPELTREALTTLQALLVRVFPVFLLVFGLLFVVEIFIDRKWIIRYLGEAAALKGWAIVIAAGVLSAGPLFAWYPLLGDLKEKGMSSALISAFLYSRALKLPLLPLMIHYFGVAYTALFSVSILGFAVLSGWLLGLIVKDDTNTLKGTE